MRHKPNFYCQPDHKDSANEPRDAQSPVTRRAWQSNQKKWQWRYQISNPEIIKLASSTFEKSAKRLVLSCLAQLAFVIRMHHGVIVGFLRPGFLPDEIPSHRIHIAVGIVGHVEGTSRHTVIVIT